MGLDDPARQSGGASGPVEVVFGGAPQHDASAAKAVGRRIRASSGSICHEAAFALFRFAHRDPSRTSTVT
jgi:hypothetical protein